MSNVFHFCVIQSKKDNKVQSIKSQAVFSVNYEIKVMVKKRHVTSQLYLIILNFSSQVDS